MTYRTTDARLTPNLLRCLSALRSLTAELGRPPSLRLLIQEGGGTSLSYTCKSLHRLGMLGFAEKRQGKWWPAEVLLVRLTPEETRYLNRGLVSIEEAIHQVIRAEMTRDAEAATVRRANLQQEPADARRREVEAEKEKRDPRTIF